MTTAKNGQTVKFHYTGKFDDDKKEVFDSSLEREPLEVTLGAGQIIQGVEKGIIGMGEGDKKTVSISPQDGYGERREDLISKVEKKLLQTEAALEVGQQWLIGEQTDPTIVTIIDVDDENVTLDANHPLAGKSLLFELELVEIVQ